MYSYFLCSSSYSNQNYANTKIPFFSWWIECWNPPPKLAPPDLPMLQCIAGFNVDVESLQLIEEFNKTHLAPSLTPLLASNAANMMINTVEKSAISHFLVSYFPFHNFPFLLLVIPTCFYLYNHTNQFHYKCHDIATEHKTHIKQLNITVSSPVSFQSISSDKLLVRLSSDPLAEILTVLESCKE